MRAKLIHEGNISRLVCGTCGKKHAVSFYAVAQLGMGHNVKHECKCGAVHVLRNDDDKVRVRQVTRGKKAA
jgi:hypothetical protein